MKPSDLPRLIAFLKDFEPIKIEIIKRILRTYKEDIISMNVDDQMFEKGIDSLGKQIGEYSPYTVKLKKAKGQRYDHVTGRDTGQMHEKATVKFGNEKFEITSYTNTAKEFTKAFTKDVWGLTPENMKKAANIVENNFAAYLRILIAEKFK